MNNGSKLRDTSPASHLKWKQSDNWRGPVQMNSLSNVRNIVSALRREYTSSVEPVL